MYSSELVETITRELSDDELDAMDVERNLVQDNSMASEPTTVAFLIGASGTVAVVIGRIIERWLETKREQGNMQAIIEMFKISETGGLAMIELAKNHSNVAVSYKFANPNE